MSLSLSVSVANSIGVSPLAVFFDATATTSIPATSSPFHEIIYIWDFGDPGSGTWGYGSDTTRSRNSAYGPLAAHVYEGSSTRTWTCYAWDGTTLASTTGNITPTDADTFYTGANTICISTTADFTGAPSGSTNITSSDFDAQIVANDGTNQRILFHAGQTFLASVAVDVLFDGMTWGKFGSGAKPIIQMVGNARFTNLGDGTSNRTGFRLMDLDFDGLSKSTCRVMGTGGGFDEVTILRCDMHDIEYGLHLSGDELDANFPSSHVWDNLCVQDCTIINLIAAIGTNGAYIWSTNFSWMGNHVDQRGGAEHGLRTPYLSKFVISNNTHEGQPATKHSLTIRGPTWTGFGTLISANSYTEIGIISGNKFMGNLGDWTVTLEPQNSTSDERLRKIIVEQNWWTYSTGTQLALKIEASDVTVRNNLCNSTGGLAHIGFEVMHVDVTGNPVPDVVRFYNNTFYSSSTDNDFECIVNDAGTNVTAYNNLGYAPSDTLHRFSTGTITASNNSTTAQIGGAGSVDPSFVSATPTVPADFKIQTGSYAKNAGISKPNYTDFFKIYRPQGASYDIGFAEFDVGTLAPWESVVSLPSILPRNLYVMS